MGIYQRADGQSRSFSLPKGPSLWPFPFNKRSNLTFICVRSLHLLRLSHSFLLQPLSRAASSLSLLNRGLVKQKNTGSSGMAVPLLILPPFGVWSWAASSGPGSYGRAWARASGGARAAAWATSVGSNKCIGRCHSLQLLRRA